MVFKFGDWVQSKKHGLGMIIHAIPGNKYTVDFDGDWIDCECLDLSIDERYK